MKLELWSLALLATSKSGGMNFPTVDSLRPRLPVTLTIPILQARMLLYTDMSHVG